MRRIAEAARQKASTRICCVQDFGFLRAGDVLPPRPVGSKATQFLAPRDMDAYLYTMMYGDYMQLPPEKQDALRKSSISAIVGARHEDVIVIFSAHFHCPWAGGVFTDGLSRALERRGYDVVVVTSRLDGAPERERLSDGVEVLRLPCWPLVGGRLPFAKPGRCQRELLATLDGRRVVAVVVNTRFYPLSLVGARFARRRGLVPLVIDHGADYLTFGNGAIDVAVRAYEHAITALLKRLRPRFYGVSEASARWLPTFGIRPSGIITNAIDAPSFRRGASGRSFRQELGVPEGAVLVAYTGRLIPEKGVEALVSAAEQLAAAGEDVAFALAGEGPLRAALEAHGVPTVHFTGRLDAADVAALLLESDIFCFPSRSEGPQLFWRPPCAGAPSMFH